MNENDNEEKKEKPLLQTISVMTVLVPLFYTAGWSYAYHYFERFNLGLMGLDIPKEYFFVYSYLVMKDQFLWFVLSLIGFAAAFFFGGPILRKIRNSTGKCLISALIRFLPAVLVPLLVFFMFYLFYIFGVAAGNNDYDWQVQHDFPLFRRIQVWADPPEDT